MLDILQWIHAIININNEFKAFKYPIIFPNKVFNLLATDFAVGPDKSNVTAISILQDQVSNTSFNVTGMVVKRHEVTHDDAAYVFAIGN